ncbi:helix-turn-helix domain-containing protein [Variovorax sp. ZT4R33]|uniref:helix-turn-helix domain-containing protein n=1 Tax=Variovorax sp. ZT4R33 TaxID=3443743 RepID=UPI003F4867BA
MPALAATPNRFARQLAQQYGLDEVAASRAGTQPLDMARMQYAQPHLFVLPPLPADEAFVVSVELSRAGSRRFFQQGGEMHLGLLEAGTVHIADLATRPSAYVCSPFHSVLFRITRAALDEFAQDAGVAPVGALRCTPGTADPVLAHLAAALLPSLQRPSEASALFLDQMALALYAHVAHAYGGSAPRAGTAAGLAPWQERRARELLGADLAHELSLAEIATACGLSRSHFGKAFKTTTGLTPHAWRTARRIEAAQQMLLDDAASLPEVAIACGFADQSHLTRVFGARVGSPPARWRHMRRG